MRAVLAVPTPNIWIPTPSKYFSEWDYIYELEFDVDDFKDEVADPRKLTFEVSLTMWNERG